MKMKPSGLIVRWLLHENKRAARTPALPPVGGRRSVPGAALCARPHRHRCLRERRPPNMSPTLPRETAVSVKGNVGQCHTPVGTQRGPLTSARTLADNLHGPIRENQRQGAAGINGGSGVDQRQRRALDPRTLKSFIHFRAKPGDGFVSPLKAEIPAPLATTPSSASVAAYSEEQIGGDADVC